MKNQSIAAAEAISQRFPLAHTQTHIQRHSHTHIVAVSFWHSLRRVAFHFNAKLMTLTLVHLPPLFIIVPHTALAALTLFVISLCTHFSLLSVVCFAHESLVWHIARSSDPLGVRTLTHTHVPRVTAQALSVCPWALFAVCFYHSILVLRFNDFIFSFVFSFHFTYHTARFTLRKIKKPTEIEVAITRTQNTQGHRTITTTVAYVSLWVPLTALLWSSALSSLRERRAKVETRMRIHDWESSTSTLWSRA